MLGEDNELSSILSDGVLLLSNGLQHTCFFGQMMVCFARRMLRVSSMARFSGLSRSERTSEGPSVVSNPLSTRNIQCGLKVLGYNARLDQIHVHDHRRNNKGEVIVDALQDTSQLTRPSWAIADLLRRLFSQHLPQDLTRRILGYSIHELDASGESLVLCNLLSKPLSNLLLCRRCSLLSMYVCPWQLLSVSVNESVGIRTQQRISYIVTPITAASCMLGCSSSSPSSSAGAT